MNQTAGVSNHCQRRSSIDLKDVGSVSPEMNWKSVGISLLVIGAVLSLIGLSIFLLSAGRAAAGPGSCVTLGDVLYSEQELGGPEVQWVADHQLLYKTRDGDLKMLNLETNQTEVLVKKSTLLEFNASKFYISPDLNYLLLACEVKKVYRYSFLGSYLIYNLYTRTVEQLNPPGVSGSVLQFASWGVWGQQLVFVFENDVYYRAELKGVAVRLTWSGRGGLVFNGVPDWLYEEILLRSSSSLWWSPSGHSLAFLTINDTGVQSVFLPSFTGELTPHTQHYPYPKAGQKNPEVKLYTVSVNGSTHSTQLLPPHTLQSRELYISMVQWVTEERVAVRWLNRPQNISILTLCSTRDGQCVPKQALTCERWVDRQNEPVASSEDGAELFLTTPRLSGCPGAFRHITLMSEQHRGGVLHYLTSGDWDVIEILTYDEKKKMLYFLSTETGIGHRQLFRVSTKVPFQRECVSCSGIHPHCSFYDASVSPDKQAVVLTCRGPGTPKSSVHLLSNISHHVTIEDHQQFQDFIRKKRIPFRTMERLQMDHHALELQLSFPPNFQHSNQYPVLLLLDSFSTAQQQRFHLDWTDVMVSCDDVIVARMDLQAQTRQNAGLTGIEDQIAALKYLVELPYVRAERLGVFGKEYGGFLTSLLLLSGQMEMRCGASVAPVFDWKLYASAITERFFGFPLKSGLNYKIPSLLPNTTHLNQPLFLILHGTADAKVHFQHTAELVKLLSVMKMNYRLQIFPDEGHEVASRRYMLNSLVSFFRECFKDNQLAPILSLDED